LTIVHFDGTPSYPSTLVTYAGKVSGRSRRWKRKLLFGTGDLVYRIGALRDIQRVGKLVSGLTVRVGDRLWRWATPTYPKSNEAGYGKFRDYRTSLTTAATMSATSKTLPDRDDYALAMQGQCEAVRKAAIWSESSERRTRETFGVSAIPLFSKP
jgi:hypothetical protein